MQKLNQIKLKPVLGDFHTIWPVTGLSLFYSSTWGTHIWNTMFRCPQRFQKNWIITQYPLSSHITKCEI